MIRVHYYRYGYEQEPKEFATVGEAADFAYQGSIQHTVYVEFAVSKGDGSVLRRHELLDLGEQRAAS